jgi:hypothetical protein
MEQYLYTQCTAAWIRSFVDEGQAHHVSAHRGQNKEYIYDLHVYRSVHLSSRIRNQGYGILAEENSKHLNRRNHRIRVYEPSILLCIFVK